MEKIKSLKRFNIIGILKCCLLAILITLIGIIVLAVVLKFADLKSVVINYINDIIKGVAIFVMIVCLKKSGEEKLLLKSIISGALYAVLTFLIFSIFNGGVTFNLGFVYDLLFAVIVAVISSIIINILKRKSI